jgi:hypothetical protein
LLACCATKTSWKNERQIEASCSILRGISRQTKTALYKQDPETRTKIFCHPPSFSRLEGLRKIYHSFKCWSQSIQLTRVHIGYVMVTWIQSGHCTYERHISNNKYNELITNERHISSSYWHSCMCHLRYYALFCLQSLCTGQMKSYHHETKHHTPTSRYGT